jgi:competence transcription factor ComK
MTNSIKDKKITAINEPAMILSVELSALQNQIAKRISATKSITARSEYGPDILAGSIRFLSYIILSKL